MFSDFLNLFVFKFEEQLGASREGAAKDAGLFQSLAEPNLVAESGKEASFSPAVVSIPSPRAAAPTSNVVFEEFGVR